MYIMIRQVYLFQLGSSHGTFQMSRQPGQNIFRVARDDFHLDPGKAQDHPRGIGNNLADFGKIV